MELKDIKKRATKVAVKVVAPVTQLTHALTGQVFDERPVELDEVDFWVQAQIDAGKMELC